MTAADLACQPGGASAVVTLPYVVALDALSALAQVEPPCDGVRWDAARRLADAMHLPRPV